MMLPKILLVIFICSINLFFLLFASSNQSWAYPWEPPDGKAGDPPGNSTCTDCHSSFGLNSGGGILSLASLPTNYNPGETYNIKVNLRHVGKSRWGFELTVLDSNNSLAGTIIVADTNNTQLVGKYLKQTLTGTFNGTQDVSPGWNFQWRAPSSGGAVTFYVAGNAANGDDSSGGDHIYKISNSLSPAPLVSASNSQISANPATLAADGVAEATIIVALRDFNNNPVSGKNVVISATGTGNTITQPSSATAVNGQTTAKIKSTKAETKTISAVDTTDNINITNSVVVAFFSTEPPVIALTDPASTFTANANAGKPFRVNVSSSNIIPAGNVKLFYKAGEQAYTSTSMFDNGLNGDGAPNDGVWGFNLSASLITLKGLAVYFVATDDRNNTTNTIALTDGAKVNQATPANIVVSGDISSPAIAVWKSSADWSMVSFPVALPNVDPEAVFAELGTPETNWQAYQFNGGADYDRAIRISRPTDPKGDVEKFTSIGSGKAAWIWHDKTSPASISLKGAKSMDLTKPFPIKVNSGWNQLGNPFLLSIPWNNAVKFGTANNVANAVSLLTAAANNQVSNPPIIYLRSGSGYVKISAEATPSMGTISGNLEPWKGYWFLSKMDGWLFIDPTQAVASSSASPVYEYADTLDLSSLPSLPSLPSPPISESDKFALANHEWKSQKDQLGQNFPNPFNPETWIPYQLSEGSEVSVEIYDIQGGLTRAIKVGLKPTGSYFNKGDAIYWDGKNQFGEFVSSGVYFYKFKAGKFVSVRKMVVIK